MKVKHTHGPWNVANVSAIYEEGTYRVEYQNFGAHRLCTVNKLEDARLIAAAPELLAEAKRLLASATYSDGQATVLTQDCEALEAAIAQAEGGK